MKKTIIATALLAATSSPVQAAYYDITGTFQMRDPTGMLMQNDTTLTGDMDLVGSYGIVSLTSTMPFFGSLWTAHDITIHVTDSETAFVDMYFDWGSTGNIHVDLYMSMTTNNDGSIDFITLDGPSNDGIAGNPMDNGPFPGFNAAFIFHTPATIPVPAAVWLFGSGLIGLLGVAKRKKNGF